MPKGKVFKQMLSGLFKSKVSTSTTSTTSQGSAAHKTEDHLLAQQHPQKQGASKTSQNDDAAPIRPSSP